MVLSKMRFWGELSRNWSHIFYHVVVVTLSAAIALSLPIIASFIARDILVYWSFVGNEKAFLISVEMALAILLILFTNYITQTWKDKKLSNIAKAAGLIFSTHTRGFFKRRRFRNLKEREGFTRDVMVIGSTGFRTFVNPEGDLHNVIKNCREARIMLLHPYSQGAKVRAKSISIPDITPENFGKQIEKSIAFLKELKAAQKNIKLKLYSDVPLFKLTIIGDYIWIKHYHPGLDVQMVPEYGFKHKQNPGGLYELFYQYFLTRWNNPDIPEYDLETDELIYRDMAGNEVRREKFSEVKIKVSPNTNTSNNLVSENRCQLERNIAHRQWT